MACTKGILLINSLTGALGWDAQQRDSLAILKGAFPLVAMKSRTCVP